MSMAPTAAGGAGATGAAGVAVDARAPSPPPVVDVDDAVSAGALCSSKKRRSLSNEGGGESLNDEPGVGAATVSQKKRKRPLREPSQGGRQRQQFVVALHDTTSPKGSSPCRTATAGSTTAGADCASVSVSIDDLQSMTADEYMALVARQAKALPDVFVATTASTTTTTSASSFPNGAHLQDALAGATRQRKRSTVGRSSTSAVIDGCAASIVHMLGGNHHDERQATTITPRPGIFWGAPTIRHLPANPKAWVASTLHQFSTLRQYLERLQACKAGAAVAASAGCGQRAQHQPALPMNRVPVPAMKDREGWYRFCVGSDWPTAVVHSSSNNSSQGPGPYHYQLDDEGDDYERTQDNPKTLAWRQQLPPSGYAPEVSLLLQLDQVMTRAVLSHLSEWEAGGCRDSGVGGGIGRAVCGNASLCTWMYALLARLEKPLHRNDAATLYRLLQRLTRERHQLVLDDECGNRVSTGGNCGDLPGCKGGVRAALSRLNVLIAIVGVYFEQGGYQAVMTPPATDNTNVDVDAAA